MTTKALLRRVLLLPIHPRAVAVGLSLLRAFGMLPVRVKAEWPPKRILVVHLTRHLGDTVMSMPFIDSLARTLPETSIDLVIASALDGPLRSVPSLRHVYRFSAPGAGVPILGSYLRLWAMLKFARREWMHRHYDLALLPRWGSDSSMSPYLAAMSTASNCCGHDPREERGVEQLFSGTDAFLTTISHGGEGMAEGVRQQLLLSACGITKSLDEATEESRTSTAVIAMGFNVDMPVCMSRLGIVPDAPFILIAPGASHASRRWSPEYFASFGCEIRNRTGYAVYSLGGPEDKGLGERIQFLSQGLVRSLCGRTSVPETIALTQSATLLLTNDSGPAHIGGAVGTSTLVLSACPRTSRYEHANSPKRVRPVGPRVVVMQPEGSAAGCDDRCQQEDAHCILGLDTQAVLAQALAMIREQGYSATVLETGRSTRAGAPAATL